MMMKRVLDALAAGAGLLALAPVLAVIAVATKLSSPGPILFRQVRVGLRGRHFKILKFRSMRLHADGPQVTIGDDPRITRVGRMLRRTKLDELPQLWNVLRGDMSLVGPRPEVPRYVEKYPPEIAREVLSVRPGVTEMLSLNLRDEASLLAVASDPERFYVEELLPKKLEAQLRYVRGRSLSGDIRIIFRTIFTLLAR